MHTFSAISGFCACLCLWLLCHNITLPTTTNVKRDLAGSVKKCSKVGDFNKQSDPEDEDSCLLVTEPSPYIEVLVATLVGVPLGGSRRKPDKLGIMSEIPGPYNHTARYYGNDWPYAGYTMIGYKRMENFRSAIEEVNRNNILGAIVELGVWRGGAMIMAAGILKEAQIRRPLYLFDAFGSLPAGSYGNASKFLAVPQDEVKKAFEFFHLYDPDIVHFVPGVFEKSLVPWEARSDLVAVLRIDANFYKSHQDAMYAFWDKVPVGGIIIFDDVFGNKNVMRFWQDFKTDQNLIEEMVRIDHFSGWFRKKSAAKLDFKKKHLLKDLSR